MIVEFVGCTASGKSTLAAKVICLLLNREQDVISSKEFFVKFFKIKPVANPTLQNILLDILLLPFLIIYLRRNSKIYLFLLRILFRKPYSFLGAVNRLRSVVRKIVINEILKKNNRKEQIFVVDEGIVHSAHNIFVYSHSPIAQKEIEVFSTNISLPDVLVCTTSPDDVIFNRTLSRRELRQVFEPKSKKKEYIERACIVFNELCKVEKIRKIVLVVNMNIYDDKGLDRQANGVVDFILEKMEAGKGRMIC